jgi:hypothetical protein
MSSVNAIIFDLSIPFEQRLERVIEQRRSSKDLVTGPAFDLLYCWFMKHRDPERFGPYEDRGERRSPLADAPEIHELVEASLAAIGGREGWDARLRLRVACRCGMTNRLENTSICVECTRYECWTCAGEPDSHSRTSGHEIVG